MDSRPGGKPTEVSLPLYWEPESEKLAGERDLKGAAAALPEITIRPPTDPSKAAW